MPIKKDCQQKNTRPCPPKMGKNFAFPDRAEGQTRKNIIWLPLGCYKIVWLFEARLDTQSVHSQGNHVKNRQRIVVSRVALKSVCKWFKVDTFTHRASIQPSNTIERPSRQTRFRFPIMGKRVVWRQTEVIKLVTRAQQEEGSRCFFLCSKKKDLSHLLRNPHVASALLRPADFLLPPTRPDQINKSHFSHVRDRFLFFLFRPPPSPFSKRILRLTPEM